MREGEYGDVDIGGNCDNSAGDVGVGSAGRRCWLEYGQHRHGRVRAAPTGVCGWVV